MMTETFRAVEPLGNAWIEKIRGEDHLFIRATLRNVAEARALRDWLNKAIPCDHRHIGPSTSGRLCYDCGATLP